jgi:MEMO1 family protein
MYHSPFSDSNHSKRVFLLGPSHHVYLNNIALSRCDTYETPIGNLSIDKESMSQRYSTKTVIKEIHKKGNFSYMSLSEDEAEHSLEMHLPYIYIILSKCFLGKTFPDGRHFPNGSDRPPLVPMMVGATNENAEKAFGHILSPYLANKENLFIVSSDFCHWYN